MKRFEIGVTYYTRSICDHDCVMEFEVLSRTNKTIVISSNITGVKRVTVYEFKDSENAMPLGRYSMAPVIIADRFIEKQKIIPANDELRKKLTERRRLRTGLSA